MTTISKLVALGFAAILSTTSALAAGHLEPEDSIFTSFDYEIEYQNRVVTLFSQAFDRDVQARMIAEPSFHPEYAVGIKKVGNTYSIFTLQLALSVWTYSSLEFMENGQEKIIKNGKPQRDDEGIAKLKAVLPSDWHDVKVDRCELPIDAPLAERIIDVWKVMLRDTHYDTPKRFTVDQSGRKVETVMVTADGESFHFSMQDGDRLAGQTVSPDKSTEPEELVAIAQTMGDLCMKQGAVQISNLEERVEVLENALKQDGSKQ